MFSLDIKVCPLMEHWSISLSSQLVAFKFSPASVLWNSVAILGGFIKFVLVTVQESTFYILYLSLIDWFDFLDGNCQSQRKFSICHPTKEWNHWNKSFFIIRLSLCLTYDSLCNQNVPVTYWFINLSNANQQRFPN